MKTGKFSERLRQAMETRQMTAAQICAQSGIGKGTMSEYLSGRYVAKSERLERLAQALGCDPRWLDGEDVPMQPMESAGGSPAECRLDVFDSVRADGSAEAVSSRSAPPEFCDGRHFWLIIGSGVGEELLLCRRQGMLRGGQTGVFIDAQGNMLVLKCEQRRDTICLVEQNGQRRVFINEETEELHLAARVVQRVQDL